MMEQPRTTDNESIQAIELAAKLKRLETNPDFIDVIQRGYIQNVLLFVSPNMNSTDAVTRNDALERVMAANRLREYFSELKYAGENGEDEVIADSEE